MNPAVFAIAFGLAAGAIIARQSARSNGKIKEMMRPLDKQLDGIKAVEERLLRGCAHEQYTRDSGSV